MAKALVPEELSDANGDLDDKEGATLETQCFPGANASVSGIGKDTLKKLGLEFLSDDDDLTDSEKDGSDFTEGTDMKDLDLSMSGMSLEKKRFRRKISEKNLEMFKGEIKEIFDILDVDGVGKIRTKEVSFAMQALGYDPGREEMKEIKSTLDPQNSGMVKYEDFSKLLIEKMTVKDPQARIKDEKTGEKQKVPSNFEDFKTFAKEWGEYWTDDEIRVMVEEADDNDTEISLEDFKKFMAERTST